jgi:hypothetical protein
MSRSLSLLSTKEGGLGEMAASRGEKPVFRTTDVRRSDN